MLFNSISFAIFLPIVFAIFWTCPQRYRWAILLVASYYFYMSWNVKYVVLIFLATFISYISALLISRTENRRKQKLYLLIALFVSLGILFIFKYFNFFSDIASSIFRFFSFKTEMIVLDLLLPVGISFYTFQTLSYVIDVYQGKVAAVYHFGKYATFVSYFPQLVAGPIERSENLLPQINKGQEFNYEQASYGLKLMGWGFFKKVMVADSLAPVVDRIFNDIYSYQGFIFIIASIMFAIQIYCDFSGYSDIARGVSKMLGIELMENFKSPYFSSSIKDFWKRWHISLSTWFRDYIYIPLGGNRGSAVKHSVNLLLTFLISGLWHGANWTFIIWGAFHGLAQILENKVNINRIPKNIRIIGVFVFTCMAWIVFRASSISDVFYIFSNMFSGITQPIQYIFTGIRCLNMSPTMWLYLVFSVLVLAVYDYFSLEYDIIKKVSSIKSIPFKWILYISFTTSLFFGMLSQYTENPNAFVYFQF